MSELVAGLNERQREAVTADQGPILVLAGPGSGKTRVLTHRIAYLIQDMKIPPSAIMAVTFTNKAAGEMRHRIGDLLGGRLRGLQIGTFHAICARILRREGKSTPFGPDYLIYDTDDQLSIIGQAMAELNIDPKKFNLRRVHNAISSAKNELITPNKFQGSDYFGEIVSRVYPRYQAILLDNNALDFDDLLMHTAILLNEDDMIREKYQRTLEFLLVDEFQDTNTAQYELVGTLGKPQDNIFVVGDEDQGIYAFRGADFRNVLNFRQDYPQSQVILLEQNYRSTQMVLDVARAIIDKNPNRTPKALFTERDDGVKITVHEAYSEEFEAQYVIDTIDELRAKQGMAWKDFAVMYRTNAQSRALEEVCIREGIPYRLIGGIGFYKRAEVKDLLAYIRLVFNGNDIVSFDRIINVPRRGIGKKSKADFQRWAKMECEGIDNAFTRLIEGEDSALSGRSGRLFADFGMMLMRWRELAAQGQFIEMLDAIIADTGYTFYARDKMSDTPEQARDREENIQELRGLVAKAQNEGITLGEFITEQSLVADVDTLADEANSITLLTLHAAKGLEYPVVFITGLEEGLLPHARSFDDLDSMAEERRLMYVGVTRAMDRLYLTYAFRRMIYGSANANVPSRFLTDLPTELVEGLSPALRIQSKIEHFREETSWQRSSSFSSAHHDDSSTSGTGDSKIRSKIIPFPGSNDSSDAAQTQYKTHDTVQHHLFGRGRVIESKINSGVEEVTVAFEDKKRGIKTIMADFLTTE